MRAYRARFVVEVSLEVEDDVIERTQSEPWQDTLYDLDEAGAVEMLARCVGILGWRLSRLDGWADLPDAAVRADLDVTFEGYRRTDVQP